MNNPNDGKLVWWKVVIFGASIFSLGYGLAQVVNLSIYPPAELKGFEEAMIIRDMTFDCGITQIEGTLSSNDFLVNAPIQISITVSKLDNETSKLKSIFLPFIIDNIHTNSISELEIFYNDQILTLEKVTNSTTFKGQRELTFNNPGNYQILFLEYDNTEQINCYSFSHEQFNIFSNNELLQIKSAKDEIRNGIIMGALSWIIVGCTGVALLVQVGLRDE